MRFFKRDRTTADPADIGGFWTWWDSARDRIAAGIADGSVPGLAGEISAQVNRIDPRLAWELAPGSVAKHALVVTPEGNAEIRPSAVAWLTAAPPADDVWEYHGSRQPGPLNTLVIDGTTVALADVRTIAAWNEAREVVNVNLWHPTFPGLPLRTRQQIAFLFLDNLLGEDDVERWIGSVDLLEAESGGRTPEELRAEVARRAAAATCDAWVLAERTDRRGERALVSANAALKHIDHPFAAHHLLVTVDRGLEQLAGSPESQELNAAEDELVAALEADGAVYAGRVTERRQRQIHFACEDPDRGAQIARDWATRFPRYGPRVQVKADPAWAFRADLLG